MRCYFNNSVIINHWQRNLSWYWRYKDTDSEQRTQQSADVRLSLTHNRRHTATKWLLFVLVHRDQREPVDSANSIWPVTCPLHSTRLSLRQSRHRSSISGLTEEKSSITLIVDLMPTVSCSSSSDVKICCFSLFCVILKWISLGFGLLAEHNLKTSPQTPGIFSHKQCNQNAKKNNQ